MQDKLKQHWNEKYKTTSQEKLGWYEETSSPSLELIQECGLSKSDSVLDIGSGSSTLIDSLIQEGYTSIIASDISEAALEITKARLGTLAAKVTFVVDDVLRPDKLDALEKVSLWHDRAVFHFFTEENDRALYLKTLTAILKPGGYVIISTFALHGLTQCSGLPVKAYTSEMLANFLGPEFKLLKEQPHLYTTTWGQERPFIYTVFQKYSRQEKM
jgi:SAM-dependent methyltransferase|tara:strand:+ start:491 stop:1135 length:645 start_codon:yes stop_codon:yes gene_type:complete